MRRAIREIYHGEVVTEGAGVRLRRMFGYFEAPTFDPFLLLDDFRSDTPADFLNGFPWHPHRGIETITYVLKGDVEHGDSLGNEGVISSGDVQWMTAGSGIIHQEMPKGDTLGSMHGFQLWANLPASHKMMQPRYRGITEDEIPVVRREDGTEVRVIAGSVDGVAGPVGEVVIDPEYLDCTVPAGVEFTHPVPQDHMVCAYVIGGRGLIDGTAVENRMLVLFGDGDEVAISGGEDPVRFLLISGKPLGEPVAWRGPIVMNTQEELEQAYKELQDGSFVREQAKEE